MLPEAEREELTAESTESEREEMRPRGGVEQRSFAKVRTLLFFTVRGRLTDFGVRGHPSDA